MKLLKPGLLAVALLISAPALAVDGKAVVGGALGGGVGAAIGSELGGQGGAIVGGALGGGIGAAVATAGDDKKDPEVVYVREPTKVVYTGRPRHVPPGHAKHHKRKHW